MGVDRHAVVVRIDGRSGLGRAFHAALLCEPLLGVARKPVARGVEAHAVGTVQQVELVLLDDPHEPLGVVGGRGVSGGLQTPRPTLVVVGRIGEERVVARLRVEKLGVVLVGGFDRGVRTETFALGVVVVVDLLAGPVALALDAEVVVGLHRQQAVAAVGFEDALRHSDACRDAVALHVGHGDRHVAADVFFACLAHLRPELHRAAEEDSREGYCFFGKSHYLCLTVTDKGIIFR